MSARSLLVLACAAGSGLACSGLSDELDRAYAEGFERGFRERFTQSCVAQRPPTADEPAWRAICACGADGMLEKYSVTDLNEIGIHGATAMGLRAQAVLEICAAEAASVQGVPTVESGKDGG